MATGTVGFKRPLASAAAGLKRWFSSWPWHHLHTKHLQDPPKIGWCSPSKTNQCVCNWITTNRFFVVYHDFPCQHGNLGTRSKSLKQAKLSSLACTTSHPSGYPGLPFFSWMLGIQRSSEVRFPRFPQLQVSLVPFKRPPSNATYSASGCSFRRYFTIVLHPNCGEINMVIS